MVSILAAALAIVSVLEISSSKANPIREDFEQAAPKPDEILTQMANLANSAPEIMCAVADLEPNKIARMKPHLNELNRILRGNPLGELFGFLENLCAHHEELRQMKQAQRHIDQFVRQNAGRAPITIKNKMKVKLVYAPRYGSRSSGEQSSEDPIATGGRNPDGGQFAKEVTADKARVTREALEDLEKLKNHAKAAHAQLSEQLVRGNEELKMRVKEAQSATRKEMTDAIDSMEVEKRKSYDYMTEAVGWLRQQMERQMTALNAELEEKKKSYRNNVDELASDIRTSLDKENEMVERQVLEATEHVRQQITDASSQLGEQLAQVRTVMEGEVEKAARDIETRVNDIREKMRAAVADLKKDFENVDAELKRSVTDASAVDTQSRAEVEKTVAEMKKATSDMREQMENEIRNAIRALSAEIKSILTDMKNANNTGEMVTAAPTNYPIQPASSLGQTVAQVPSQSPIKGSINNNYNNDEDDEGEIDGGLESHRHGIASEVHQNTEFEDDFEDDEIDEDEK